SLEDKSPQGGRTSTWTWVLVLGLRNGKTYCVELFSFPSLVIKSSTYPTSFCQTSGSLSHLHLGVINSPFNHWSFVGTSQFSFKKLKSNLSPSKFCRSTKSALPKKSARRRYGSPSIPPAATWYSCSPITTVLSESITQAKGQEMESLKSPSGGS